MKIFSLNKQKNVFMLFIAMDFHISQGSNGDRSLSLELCRSLGVQHHSQSLKHLHPSGDVPVSRMDLLPQPGWALGQLGRGLFPEMVSLPGKKAWNTVVGHRLVKKVRNVQVTPPPPLQTPLPPHPLGSCLT